MRFDSYSEVLTGDRELQVFDDGVISFGPAFSVPLELGVPDLVYVHVKKDTWGGDQPLVHLNRDQWAEFKAHVDRLFDDPGDR